jgi:hypothetical protein
MAALILKKHNPFLTIFHPPGHANLFSWRKQIHFTKFRQVQEVGEKGSMK